MSNHPQPAYGPMFNPNPPVASSTAASYPGMQQYQYSTQGYNPYWQGQGPLNGMSFAHSTNGYAHHANVLGANPPAFSGGLAQAPYGGYANAAQYTAAPMQSYPAVANPAYAAIPYHSQALMNSNDTPSNDAAANAANSAPNHQPASAEPVVAMGAPDTAKEFSPELEDGELSNGEVSNSIDDLYENEDITEMRDRSPPKPTQSFVPGLDGVNDRDSVDSFDSVNQTPSAHIVPTETTNIAAAQRPQNATPSVREQAQNILRELQSYEIGFQDIAKEGFDLDLLQVLYAEIGIVVPSVEQRKLAESGEQPSNAEKLVLSTQEKPSDPSNVMSSHPDPSTEESKANTSVNYLKTSATSTPPHVLDMTSKHDLRAATAGKGAPKLPPVDRKEYIARMLAAKSGKPPRSSNAASVTLHMPINEKATPSDNGPASPKDTPSTLNANMITEPSAASTDSIQAQKQTLDLEAKKKAQTNLARQKMEALKAQKQVQLQKSHQANDKASEPEGDSLALQTTISSAQDSAGSPRESRRSTPLDRRQGSYFSPVSLKPAFNIPGLFTASQYQSMETQEKLQDSPHISISSTTQRMDTTDASAAILIEPRKKQIAADFMQPSSTTFQKLSSQNEDAGVVIDISEDESAEDSEDPYKQLMLRSGGCQATEVVKKLDMSNTAASSNITGQSKTNHVTATNTPPNIGSPGISQELKDLKTREIEIETMNRKILELEQRRKAKQAASRVQSPRPATIITSGASTADQQFPVTAAQRIDTATEEQLIEEKEKLENKLADAEAEQSRIARIEDQISRQEQQPLVEGFLRPTEIENPRLGSEVQQAGMQAKQHSNVSDAIKNERKVHLEAELAALDADITASESKIQSKRAEVQHLETLKQFAADRKQVLQQELVKFLIPTEFSHESQEQPGAKDDAVMDQGQSRAPQLKGGFSPANVLRAGSDDRGLPGQTDHNDEEQIPKSISDEYTDTKAARERPEAADTTMREAPGPDEDGDRNDRLSHGELEEDNMDISGSEVEEGQVSGIHDETASKPDDAMDITDDDDVYEPPSEIGPVQSLADIGPEIQASKPDLETGSQLSHLAAGQVGETLTELADAAVTAVAEGRRLYIGNLAYTTTDGDLKSFFEDYPVERISIPTNPRSTRPVGYAFVDLLSADEAQKAIIQLPGLLIHDRKVSVQLAHKRKTAAKKQSANALLRNEHVLDGIFKQPDVGEEEDDDYEPPEPESFKGEGTTGPTKPIAAGASAQDTSAETAIESEHLIEPPAVRDGQFVPYESPLKHFVSYRFHPEYRSKVPGGFRSLTYSNDIRPEVPICRYELGGGVCNDPSCTSQHFQKMGLPDHIILGQIGKGEGSTPEEKGAYINGLRSVILDLRERQIKDLDAIAEAISQYRLKFLDDTSKVLPL